MFAVLCMCAIPWSVSYSLTFALYSWKWISFYTFETKRGKDLTCLVAWVRHFSFYFYVCIYIFKDSGNWGSVFFSEINAGRS